MKDEHSKLYTGDGSVDIKGNPVLKENTGNWRACPFILGKCGLTLKVWFTRVGMLLLNKRR